MKFDSNEDLRRFARLLAGKMESRGHHSIAHDLKEWSGTSFTILSEFLEELWLILRRVESLNDIDPELKQQEAIAYLQ